MVAAIAKNTQRKTTIGQVAFSDARQQMLTANDDITCSIPVDFRIPVHVIAFGPARPAAPFAAVAVPEAAMDEDNGFPLGENDVGLAWQGLLMQTKAETQTMKQPSNAPFRLRVLTGYPPHVFGTLLLRNRVHAAVSRGLE